MKFVTIFIFTILVSANLFSFSGKGSGTDTDPYQITNVKELQEIGVDTFHLKAHYILMNDIEASETKNWNIGDHDADPATPDSAMGFVPIGEYIYDETGRGFSGKFYGNNYSIENLYINRPFKNNVGLFGSITDGSNISYINISASITGNSFVGILVGYISDYNGKIGIKVESCSVNGTIKGNNKVGGLYGENNSNNGKSEIKNCKADSCYVSAKEYVGGFCGRNMVNVIISNCLASGTVYGNSKVGGFCGCNIESTITESQSFVNIEGNEIVGGFCGINHTNSDTPPSISSKINNCSSTTDILASNDVGGFCGINEYSFIENCTSSGTLMGGVSVGGFVGDNSCGNIKNCATDMDIRGFNTVGGFCGKYSNCFTKYAENPFKKELKNCKSSGYVIGSKLVGGFVGYIDHLGIQDIYSTGRVYGDSTVGGICGKSVGVLIKNCKSNTDISGVYKVGGLIGEAEGTSLFFSKNIGNIKGTEKVGGLIGYMDGSDISNSYNSGIIEGHTSVGGIVGLIERSHMSNTLSYGVVQGEVMAGSLCGWNKSSDVRNCYRDIEASGINNKKCGEAKTTSEMMQKITYEDWDFERTWCIDEGNDYPRLQALDSCGFVSVEEEYVDDLEIKAYPNPFSESVNISYNLSKPAHVRIEIHDLYGNLVFESARQFASKGDHNLNFDGYNLTQSVYYYTLIIGNESVSGKVIFIQ